MPLKTEPLATESLCSTEATRLFLADLVGRIDKPFANFTRRLRSALEDSDMPMDDQFQIFDRKDLSAIYLTHIAAMEACLLRTVFDVNTADALLAELGEQLEELEFSDGSRSSESLSGIFWDVLARVQISTIDETKKAHDIALKHLLGVLGLRRKETNDVFKDFVVRQALSETLALCTSFWWIGLAQRADITVSDTDSANKSGLQRLTDMGLPGSMQ